MKKKYLAIIFYFAAVIAVYFYFTSCYRNLPELKNYTISSDTGKIIPAKLYSRIILSSIKGKQQKVSQIVVRFDDFLVDDKDNKSGSDEKLYQHLLIVPQFKMIGLMDHVNSFKLTTKGLCQCSEESDVFTPIVNNRSFYNDPPVKTVSFDNNEIRFNTYGILKKFGNTIIIRIKK